MSDLHSIRSTLMSLQANGAVSALIDPLVQLVEEVGRQAARTETRLDNAFELLTDLRRRIVSPRSAEPVADSLSALIAGLRKEVETLRKERDRAVSDLALYKSATTDIGDRMGKAACAEVDKARLDTASAIAAWLDTDPVSDAPVTRGLARLVREGRWRK